MNDETKVTTEEASKEVAQWLEPSPVGGEFMRHAQAMEPASRVPVYKAFAIAPGFNVGMLRKMAENYKPKRIVVIDHGEAGFEVRRLGNSDDVSLFYASLNLKLGETLPAQEEQKSHLLRIICEFLESDDAHITKYDPLGVALREACCIGYTYLHRRVSGIAAFRKDEEGSTAGIKKALSQMEAEGLLRKLSEEETNELFGTGATVYRINKGVF